MEQTETSINPSMDVDDTPAIASQVPSAMTPSSENFSRNVLTPQSGGETCATCGGAAAAQSPPSYVYALGKIEWRFPKQSVEKEVDVILAFTNRSTDVTEKYFVRGDLSRWGRVLPLDLLLIARSTPKMLRIKKLIALLL
jgi:hypothetical protein